MKLYTHVDRVYNELSELGKSSGDALTTEELSTFDQLHYHGTEAVDFAIDKIGITDETLVLEVGSGIGGPARHIGKATHAAVTALELQSDQNKVAEELTRRCGLAQHVSHVCGDFLTHDWQGATFNSIVSWLAIYHIPQREKLLSIAHDLLPAGGCYYAEDLYSRQLFAADERDELMRELYASHMPDWDTYQREITDAGFTIEVADDMSDDWLAFTAARLQAYRDNRERHVRVHDEPTVNALDHFYGFVVRCFESGKLGGIRLLARKN